ncbi:MAG: glutamine-hydrolyzing GMP synthase [Candidatus Bipolaricaulia bacterium]
MEQILVLDFGSQYTKLVAKAVRGLSVYSEIVPYDIPADEIERMGPKGLILSGGPASVYEKDSPHPDPRIYGLGIPILGICYGMQLLAQDLGGRVVRAREREYGLVWLDINDGKLFQGLEPRERVWMSHGDAVAELPPDFIAIACSEGLPIAAIRHRKKEIYGIQFHPEVAHTPKGKEILQNFSFEICGVRERWNPGDLLEEKICFLREQLKGAKRCIIGVSGGVDSSTAAVLVHRAIGERLVPVYIDTGLMREGEGERVRRVFTELGLGLHYAEARAEFFKTLEGVVDPEEKRRRVGAAFIRVFEREARRLERELGEIEYLVQGTIYSDVIESAGARGARRIKSHHNVGGLPKRLNFKIVEPLREFFKDEVREIATQLGLPKEIIWEQPFPGPGLAVRIIGEVTPARVETLQAADAILREELSRLPERPWQYFAVLLPIRSVAILGDERGYGQVVALRAVDSVDGMTADWSKLPHGLLERISSRITNEVSGVTRVVYDITSTPPGTIEWE